MGNRKNVSRGKRGKSLNREWLKIYKTRKEGERNFIDKQRDSDRETEKQKFGQQRDRRGKTVGKEAVEM